MSARSIVFKTMFESGMKEAKENAMDIPDFDYDVIKKMIDFCETDAVPTFQGLEEDVFKIAHKYNIQDLMVCFLSYIYLIIFYNSGSRSS